MITTKTINKGAITRGKMKMVITDNEVEKMEEVEKVTIKEIIKRNLTRIDQSTKIKKSTKKNQIDKYLMIQTTQQKRRKKMEIEIIKEEEEVGVNNK